MNPATRMMVQKLNALAAQGMSYQQAADDVGATYHYVARMANVHGIPFLLLKRGPKLQPPNARSEDMRLRYIAGETLKEIGKSYSVTRERVRQILTKHYGIRANDGGRCESTRKARKEFNRKRDARSLKHWGCTYREYQRILKHPGQPSYAFSSQRRNAYSRGIAWEMNLWQWWKLWEQSGRWSERGRGRGYCMCRLNDCGPYSADNVYIATGVENMQDYWVNKHAADQQVAA